MPGPHDAHAVAPYALEYAKPPDMSKQRGHAVIKRPLATPVEPGGEYLPGVHCAHDEVEVGK